MLAFGSSAFAGNWPAWRGPGGNGISDETGVPLHWSQDENIKWKIPLPGPGNSTPIVWENRVFVTGAREKGTVRALMCFDRGDGSLLWQREVTYEKPEATHDSNPYCSSSPVTDGQRVIMWHGSAGVFAYDLQGELLWSKPLGEFQHIWGNASSPVIYHDLVILSCGPGLTAYVVALDKRTGEQVWRYDPPTAVSEKVDEYRGSWSTPVLHRSGDHDELLLSLPLKLVAIDPTSGKELWWCEGPTKLVYTSPLAEGDTVVTMCGYGGTALAVKSGGSGDVTETRRLWLHDQKNPQRVGSGVIVDGYIYILNEPGIAWCIELASGEKKWEKRLDNEDGTSAQSWSSMTHVDGRLYICDMAGTTFVLEPSPEECRVLATNSLGELTRASLAFSDGQIFQRTYEHLYCIEGKK